MNNPLSKMMASSAVTINYYPMLNKLTGSVLSSLLLNQINYWWHVNKGQPFYKFDSSCKHQLCREGDSWEDELGFCRSELDRAKQKKAQKLGEPTIFKKTTGSKWRDDYKNYIVVYWTDLQRVTWYAVNTKLLESELEKLYKNDASDNYVMHDPALPIMHDPALSTTENTTENKKKKENQENSEIYENNYNISRHHECEPPKFEPTPQTPINQLIEYLSNKHGMLINPCYDNRQKWIEPLERMLKLTGGDVEATKEYLTKAYEILSDLAYRRETPFSLWNTFRKEWEDKDKPANKLVDDTAYKAAVAHAKKGNLSQYCDEVARIKEVDEPLFNTIIKFRTGLMLGQNIKREFMKFYLEELAQSEKRILIAT